MLIGLSGYATSGKDAVADRLRDAYGFTKLYMSQELERALLKLNPWIPIDASSSAPEADLLIKGILPNISWIRYAEMHDLIGYDASKTNPEVRRLLQVLGTEVGREMIDQDLWVRLVFRKVDDAMGAGHDVAITGIRYPNELEWVRRRGGVVVWVDRGLAPVNGHTSDNSLGQEHCDLTLINWGTLDDLYTGVDWLRQAVDSTTEVPA